MNNIHLGLSSYSHIRNKHANTFQQNSTVPGFMTAPEAIFESGLPLGPRVWAHFPIAMCTALTRSFCLLDSL